jgi:hypothetical protein
MPHNHAPRRADVDLATGSTRETGLAAEPSPEQESQSRSLRGSVLGLDGRRQFLGPCAQSAGGVFPERLTCGVLAEEPLLG